MLKLLLICTAVAAAVLQTAADETPSQNTSISNECKLSMGKLTTFEGIKNRLYLPCKVNMIRQTCGEWIITMTPGMTLAPIRGSDPVRLRYVVATVFISLREAQGEKELKLKINSSLVEDYMAGKIDLPILKKSGCLDIKILNITTRCKGSVDLRIGPIEIEYWEFDGLDPKSSGLYFKCNAKNFVAAPGSQQLCGASATKPAHIIRDVLTKQGIVQTNPYCRGAARTMQDNCQKAKTSATKQCMALLSSTSWYECLKKPRKTFRDCIKFVCSGYQDPNACCGLKEELSACPPQASTVVTEVSKKCGSKSSKK